MSWIRWASIKALTVDPLANLLVGSNDVSSVQFPDSRPIMTKGGRWIAYGRPETNEMLYSYSSNGNHNEAAGQTTFHRDVTILGRFGHRTATKVFARGLTNGSPNPNYNVYTWTPIGPGIVDIVWQTYLSLPVVIVTAENNAAVTVATVASVTPQSCRVVCALLDGSGVNCIINFIVLGDA